MCENIPELQSEYTKAEAEEAYKQENYALACDIYKELWEKSQRSNTYYFSKLGHVLRKDGRSEEYIDLCSEVKADERLISNEHVITAICWCLYNCRIKNYDIQDKERFDDFIKAAEYIVRKCKQEEAEKQHYNPYVHTIIKVAKVLKKRNTSPYKIINWLEKLEPSKLSDVPFGFMDKKGIEREIASSKEDYYSLMSRAYEKTIQYEKSIEVCKQGLSEVTKLHNRNHVWLKARMHYCKCMLEHENSTAIKEYKKIADKEKHWFMYHKLSDIFFRKGDIEKALLYASKAFDGRFENEIMVNLMQDTAVLWQANGDSSKAKVFYQGSVYYRNLYSWSINEELEFAVISMEIDIEVHPNIKQIQKISSDFVESIEGKAIWEIGQIHNIKSNEGYGFLAPKDGGDNIYFRLVNILNNDKLKKSDTVEYQTEEYKGRIRAYKVRKRK